MNLKRNHIKVMEKVNFNENDIAPEFGYGGKGIVVIIC